MHARAHTRFKSKPEAESEDIHLGSTHVQLVEDVFLHSGSSCGCQSHHCHIRELLTQFMQLLVVWAEIVAPLKDLKRWNDSKWLLLKIKAYSRIGCA